MRTKWVVLCASLGAILAMLLIARAAVSGQGIEPTRLRSGAALFYGPMSIGPGQTGRVYAANVADPTSRVRTNSSDDQLELSFFDEFGRLQAHSVEIVPPGRTAMLEFTSRDTLLIRAEVRLLSGWAPFVSSLELFGSDGEVLQFVHPQTEDSVDLFGVRVKGNAPIPNLCSTDSDCPAELSCRFGVCLPF